MTSLRDYCRLRAADVQRQIENGAPRFRSRGLLIRSLATSFRFRAVVSLTILAAILSRLDARVVVAALVSMDPGYFLGAIAIGAAARAAQIARWAILLRAVGVSVSGRSTARVFLISSFLGTALPTGAADVARAYGLSKYNVRGRTAAASVLVDRLLGISALLTLGIFSLALGMPDADPPVARLIAGLCFAVAVLLFSGLWADRLFGLLIPRRRRGRRVSQWILRAADEMAHYRMRRGALGIVFGLSLIVQWLRITEVFLLGAGLGLDVGFGYYLVFMPIGLVVLMLPVSIAGVGLPQGVIMWLLRPAGILDAQSFALSTLMVAVGVIGTLPGFYLYVRARGERRDVKKQA